VAIVAGDLIVRRLHQTINTITLIPENPKLSAIKIEEFSDLQVWGVVTYVIHAM
jgi:SOS-response transcriptional repressor LexA